MTRLTITAGAVTIAIETRDTPTAAAILEVLPIHARAQTWGEEVYFDTPVSGPTPVSRGDEIRLASPANIWADALDDVRAMAKVRDGETVVVEAVA